MTDDDGGSFSRAQPNTITLTPGARHFKPGPAPTTTAANCCREKITRRIYVHVVKVNAPGIFDTAHTGNGGTNFHIASQ